MKEEQFEYLKRKIDTIEETTTYMWNHHIGSGSVIEEKDIILAVSSSLIGVISGIGANAIINWNTDLLGKSMAALLLLVILCGMAVPITIGVRFVWRKIMNA